MIVVTGGAGFLGRRVVAALREHNRSVRVLIRRPAQAEVVKPYGVEAAYGDTRDADSLNRAFEGATGLIHLVAVIRIRGGATFRSVNVEGTRNVYSAASVCGVRRSVLVSAIGAAPRSPEPYFASRWEGEEEARASGIATTVVRFSSLFGEGDEFFNVMAALVKVAPVVPIPGKGKTRFQPIHVEDAAQVCVRALQDDSKIGRTYELGGPDVLTYRQMVSTTARAMGKRRLQAPAPPAVMGPAVTAMSWLMETPPVTPDQFRMLRYDSVGKPGLVESEFRFKPRPLRGNIDFVRSVTYWDAVRIMLGRMPRHIRDH
ncbi:MAG: NAD-dependent epimerase/dehydratase family protein [Chloroflexi bacterium]|nr:NAD-dependent epimerase/dehydratase family protein [Chloroflexota bacterium]